MHNRFLFLLTLAAIIFASSCKKDEKVAEEDDTCTETRDFWLKGAAGTWEFATDEPCSNLRLQQGNIGQYMHEVALGAYYLFILGNEELVVDSNGTNQGKFEVKIGIFVPPSQRDSTITSSDTVYTVSANTICANMKLGPHYQFAHTANSHNANVYQVKYTDTTGNLWDINSTDGDSSFVITSIDGIVSQSPGNGAHLPYCTVKFSYNLLMRQGNGTDTLRVKGSGRLGFR